MNNDLPLVSVVVITYNSAKTVLETLESIKNQTYTNIELIISDDCSKDDTVSVCREWVDKNKEHFYNIIIVDANENKGITANCNRGCIQAHGEWIKCIAGDDLLNSYFIERNIQWITERPSIDIVFSKVRILNETKKKTPCDYVFSYEELLLPNKKLLYRLLQGNFLPAPTAFIKRKVYIELEGFDEKIPMMEDWPFWIKAAYNNKQFSLLNEYLATYRISSDSISTCGNKSLRYIQSELLAKKNASYYQRKIGILFRFYNIICEISYRNKWLAPIRILNLINPYYYYFRRIHKELDSLKNNI